MDGWMISVFNPAPSRSARRLQLSLHPHACLASETGGILGSGDLR